MVFLLFLICMLLPPSLSYHLFAVVFSSPFWHNFLLSKSSLPSLVFLSLFTRKNERKRLKEELWKRITLHEIKDRTNHDETICWVIAFNHKNAWDLFLPSLPLFRLASELQTEISTGKIWSNVHLFRLSEWNGRVEAAENKWHREWVSIDSNSCVIIVIPTPRRHHWRLCSLSFQYSVYLFSQGESHRVRIHSIPGGKINEKKKKDVS